MPNDGIEAATRAVDGAPGAEVAGPRAIRRRLSRHTHSRWLIVGTASLLFVGGLVVVFRPGAESRRGPQDDVTALAVDTSGVSGSANRPPSAPLPDGAIVGWRPSGELVVVDLATGTTIRQLAKVETGYPAKGPSGVALTPDRRLAIVVWNEQEHCAQRIGVVPTDGSASLVPWGPGSQPTINPDGTKVAWNARPDRCSRRELVVRDVASGDERTIVLGYDEKTVNKTAGVGPWWQDNTNLVFVLSKADPSPAYKRDALRFNSATATKASDASRVGVACLPADVSAIFAQPTPTGDGLVISYPNPSGRGVVIAVCRYGSARPQALFTTPTPVFSAAFNKAGSGLLLLGQDGAVSTVTRAGQVTSATPGPFQSVAW